MTTIEIFKKNQIINDSLRALLSSTTPQERSAEANKIQDVVTSLCCELIDVQNEIKRKEEKDGVPDEGSEV